jgi:hypothetical protein
MHAAAVSLHGLLFRHLQKEACGPGGWVVGAWPEEENNVEITFWPNEAWNSWTSWSIKEMTHHKYQVR